MSDTKKRKITKEEVKLGKFAIDEDGNRVYGEDMVPYVNDTQQQIVDAMKGYIQKDGTLDYHFGDTVACKKGDRKMTIMGHEYIVSVQFEPCNGAPGNLTKYDLTLPFQIDEEYEELKKQ